MRASSCAACACAAAASAQSMRPGSAPRRRLRLACGAGHTRVRSHEALGGAQAACSSAAQRSDMTLLRGALLDDLAHTCSSGERSGRQILCRRPVQLSRLKSQAHCTALPSAVAARTMDVFAPVRDENALPAGELRGGKAFGGGGRAFGTPAAKQAGGDAARRAFGDLSNRGAAGPLTGPGKLAAATPRRALGDITNGGAAVASATAAKAPAAGPAACGVLPEACSARTASFLTEAMVAQSEVWAAEGTEALAGLSAAQQQAEERRAHDARLQARLACLFAPEAPAAEDDAAVRARQACAAWRLPNARASCACSPFLWRTCSPRWMRMPPRVRPSRWTRTWRAWRRALRRTSPSTLGARRRATTPAEPGARTTTRLAAADEACVVRAALCNAQTLSTSSSVTFHFRSQHAQRESLHGREHHAVRLQANLHHALAVSARRP